MISIAIALQIIVGVIALRVSIIDKFFKTFNDHLVEEEKCWRNCIRFKDDYIERGGVSMDSVEAALDAENVDLFTMLTEIQNGPTDGNGRTYHSGNRINPMFEERMYEWYEIWKAVMGVCELRAAGAKKELEAIISQIERQQSALETITTKRDTFNPLNPNSQSINEQIAALRKELTEDNQRLISKRKLHGKYIELETSLQEQGKVLQAYVDAITREKVYKSSSRWQRNINYILYTMFILNAAIVAFGMTDFN